GSPGALETLRPLVGHDDATIRRTAAAALAACSRPGNVEALLEALRHSDESVRIEAALGLSACGDSTAMPVLFGKAVKVPPAKAFEAALALGKKAENNLLSFLDDSSEAIRARAFLSLMLMELFD